MTEIINTNKEFDQNNEYTETEKQLIPLYHDTFDHYKEKAELQAIEQIYLSQPDEPYSLRLRETVTTNGTEYSATLKDRGYVTAAGLTRMEIETPISAEAYNYYKEKGTYPLLRKLRAEVRPGITIDWCEGLEAPIVEIENLATDPNVTRFYADYYEELMDYTGMPETSSEALAYKLSPNLMSPTPEDITTEEIVDRIKQVYLQDTSMPIVVGISGRSGSGKTTLTEKALAQVKSMFLTARVSTDDYHRGKKWLEATYGGPWTNWDAPEVYDTKLLNADLKELWLGNPIASRRFDFEREEPVITGEIGRCEVLFVEGIYAGSPDLEEMRHLHFNVPTPIATSIGRRLARDQQENRLNASLADPRAILRYQLEIAEPTYQQQNDAEKL